MMLTASINWTSSPPVIAQLVPFPLSLYASPHISIPPPLYPDPPLPASLTTIPLPLWVPPSIHPFPSFIS